MPTCLIALGANLGDREAALDEALQQIAARIDSGVTESSRVITDSVGGPSGQSGYLNSAALVSTEATPQELLRICQAIENQFAPRDHHRWAARELDLDLLLVDQVVMKTRSLRLPHPRLSFRAFVAGPAAELLPGWVHPEISVSLESLYAKISAPEGTLLVVGEGEAADRSSHLAKKIIGHNPLEVGRVRRAGDLRDPGSSLTIDATEDGARTYGPRLRVADCDPSRLAEEIAAAIRCVWRIEPPASDND